ncbi:hypothetical protein TNCV_4189191 [Trichonephila clavipes]|nr:hypothetical protein TNCV_4189191 [Trichonephila clavipes]
MDVSEKGGSCCCVSDIRNLVERNCNKDLQASFDLRTAMDDNARPPRARIVVAYFEQGSIQRMQWPS